MVTFDYVSDLHIDYWDKKYTKTVQKHQPMKWYNNSDILIIAGDISNDLKLSIDYIIKEIKPHYKKVLFIDGNREHYDSYPIVKDINLKLPKNIHYLPKEDIRINNTIFIGICGWWNYSQSKNIEHKSIYKCANKEFNIIVDKLNKYEKDEKIKEIVMVTHTVPLPRFVRHKDTDFNNNFIKINVGRYKKIKRWVFGHVHHKYFLKGCGIAYMCNPRGRPNDFNQGNYEIETTFINKL
jgi:hypothetical protein